MSGLKWLTENHFEWECAITTGSAITDYGFWAGLKKTNTPLYTTDVDQAYFVFSTNDDHFGTFAHNTKLHFVYSTDATSSVVDYVTEIPITVAANTTYRLRINIDSSRQVSVFVNDVQYGLTRTGGTTGTTESTATTKSRALKDDQDLIPYVGVQNVGASAVAKEMYLHLSLIHI